MSDVSARILAKMSVSVSASWNSSFNACHFSHGVGFNLLKFEYHQFTHPLSAMRRESDKSLKRHSIMVKLAGYFASYRAGQSSYQVFSQ